MKILVVGRVGQLGSALSEVLPGHYETKYLDQPDIDLAVPSSLREIVLSSRPAIVINAAAYTSVDRAESEVALAHTINANAPCVMASACKEIDAVFIHYSTDFVFDGASGVPYTENSPTAPASVYGQSKLAGEEAITAATERHVILRTAWLYSSVGHNFLKTMLRLAQDSSEIRVVDDQVGSPTYAWDLALVTRAIVDELARGNEDSFGLYHAVNAGATSWHGFATKIFDLMGWKGVRVRAIATEEYPTPAPRPRFSVLSCERLRQTFDLTLPDWHNAVTRCLQRLQVENGARSISL
jgi:dTDP-4-dehydrorhamnose reductase